MIMKDNKFINLKNFNGKLYGCSESATGTENPHVYV